MRELPACPDVTQACALPRSNCPHNDVLPCNLLQQPVPVAVLALPAPQAGARGGRAGRRMPGCKLITRARRRAAHAWMPAPLLSENDGMLCATPTFLLPPCRL